MLSALAADSISGDFNPELLSGFYRRYYVIKRTANSCIALCSSTKAVRISSARTVKRVP